MKLNIIVFTLFFAVNLPATERKFTLNPQISPCQNFYQHVCSNEIEAFQMPPTRSRYTFFFADAYEDFSAKLESFLKTLSKEKVLSHNGEQLIAFYKSCTDKPARISEEKLVTKRIVDELQNLMTRNEVLEFAARAVKTGELGWFSFSNHGLLSDPKKWRVEIFTAWLTMPDKSYYESPQKIADLTSLVAYFFETLKLSSPLDRAKSVVELEKQIAQVFPTAQERREWWNTEKYWSQIEFLTAYPRIAQQINAKIIPAEWPIHQYTVPLYNFLEKYLQEGDLQSIKDLLTFRLLSRKIYLSHIKWDEKFNDFKSKHLGEPAKRLDLEQECARTTQNWLGGHLAQEMINKFFANYPRAEFTSLVASIRATLLQEISNNSWLSPESRKRAIKKVNAMRMGLLYPEKLEDWRVPPVGKLFSNAYLENLKLIYQADDLKSLAEMRGERNLEGWSVSPIEFEAYYTWSENRFYFPAAFASKTFNPEKDKIENLGAIGFYIAHELGHALDKYGSQFNELGVKKSIFDEKDQKQFEKLSEGFIQQFNTAGHNGGQTLAENLADHVGLFISYKTAFPEPDLEKQKTFFYSFARTWCTKMTDAYRASFLKEDTHALPESRINEQLKHLPAFAETFQCKPDAEMVLPPEKRLKIW